MKKDGILGNSEKRFLIFLVGLIFLIWLLVKSLYYFLDFDLILWFKELPIIYPFIKSSIDNLSSATILGIIITFSLTSSFISPIPNELIFYSLLLDGMIFTKALILTFLGVLLGQHINYFVGKWFGKVIQKFIKVKKRKNVREKLDNYGIYAIFTINLLPLPFPLFNFVTGMVKFDYKKWLISMALGLFIKFAIIYLIYLFI